MRTFFKVIRNTWSEYFEYRLNFIMWRVRNILRLLVVYFLWWAIFSSQNLIFGYDQTRLLTYIIATLIVSSIVFSTRTQDIGAEIVQGDLSNLLLKPINTFTYWFAREISDKFLNVVFSVVELFLIIIFLQPVLFFSKDFLTLLMVFIFIFISLILYFLIGLLLSFFGFWTPDIWGPRFLFLIILDFFAGSLFPLDILPKPFFNLLEFLPFPYLIFFPIKIYLGQVNIYLFIKGLVISLSWIGILFIITKKVWQRGLLVYGAYGR